VAFFPRDGLAKLSVLRNCSGTRRGWDCWQGLSWSPLAGADTQATGTILGFYDGCAFLSVWFVRPKLALTGGSTTRIAEMKATFR